VLGGSISGGGWEFFSPPSALGPTQPPFLGVPGILSPGVKRLRREADHSPPSSAEVKNAWRYTSTPNTSLWRGARLSAPYLLHGAGHYLKN
jgi:hypothetical protein